MDRIHLQIDGDDYWIEGGEFDEMLECVRALAGRRFDSGATTWVIPGQPADIASRLAPFRLMYLDSDPLADSKPSQVRS